MWKYAPNNPDVVYRINADGSMESCFATREDVQEWIAEGNTPEPADAPV